MEENQLILLGRLNQSVSGLSDQVKELEVKVDNIQGQLNKGKGVIAGMFLMAGGVGAAIGNFFNNSIGGS